MNASIHLSKLRRRCQILFKKRKEYILKSAWWFIRRGIKNVFYTNFDIILNEKLDLLRTFNTK